MIPLIVLPFAALFVAIITVSVMRGVRRIREAGPVDWSIEPKATQRKPTDLFHDQIWLPLCNSIAEAAALRLKRPLSNGERYKIWRARTPLVLEIALQEIQTATTSDGVAAVLANLPRGMKRPDPSGWCESSVNPGKEK